MKSFLVVLFLGSQALASQNYDLSLTNGSQMPISGGIVYVIEGQRGLSEIGDTPSPGLISLCQMGDPTLKLSEVKANPKVVSAITTGVGIMPGQKITLSLTVPHPETESIHFEAMYGKSKEACASIRIESKNLEAREGFGTDQVISAGASKEPMITSNTDLLSVCQNAPDAIGCLRNLTPTKSSGAQIHSFAGYLPGVLNFLEVKFGPDDVLTLFIPQAGAVNYDLHRR